MWKKTLIIFIAAVVCLGGGFLVGTLVQHGGFANLPNLLGFGAEAETAGDWSGKVLTTGDNIVNVRNTAVSDGEIVTTLTKNTEVICLSQEGEDWCYVEVMEDVKGYVVKSFMSVVSDYDTTVETEEKPEPKVVFVTPKGDYDNIREEALADAEIIGVALKGDVLEKIEEEGDWVKIKTADGIEGYIASELLTEAAATEAENAPRQKVEITNSYANIRSEASADADLVQKLDRGDTAIYLGEEQGWYYILLDSGKRAYVRNDLAKVVAE